MDQVEQQLGNIEFKCGVPLHTLQQLGLGLSESWDPECFGLNNNRLIFADHQLVGALITKADFGYQLEGDVEEIVAIEILPNHRGNGLAALAIAALSDEGGRVHISSPNEKLMRALLRRARVQEVENDVVQAVFRNRHVLRV